MLGGREGGKGTNEPLDSFDVQVFLLSRCEVGAHDTAFQTSGDFAREHSTKGVESAFVRCRYHLGNVHHQRCIRITVLDT